MGPRMKDKPYRKGLTKVFVETVVKMKSRFTGTLKGKR